MNYLYLHGFASSPQSTKARYMQQKFAELGLTLHVPDLNLTDFSTVTLSEQLDYLDRTYLHNNEPIVVLGSSLGGFLALQLAAKSLLVQKLILLAPAFGFSHRIAKALGEENVTKWQQEGVREFYHYGLKRNVNLQFQFFVDAQKYSEENLTRSLPILIFHGIDDDVVPASLSKEFAKRRSQVTLKLLNDDHALGKDLDSIWQDTKQFLELS
ncbi:MULTISPECIES: YqiA/YcfP family alpha/beta fold hydrolase [Pseudanabaena]|uniref:YqiA/YcfP family alpha/beta fold hydrolase n=1 Tax=Pseudanabaena TaxID=1152 RepID=UPI0024796CAA|nr:MULTISPECIES: YqiA/YcfP family alpha/beta fold hydrolase [Pseudanabaena]MEA5488927.1 YqiA/YcfP family alpha/beta fold hydrolase [Pseudanabaena sp. CCNP1317]WGS70784.1 alpha/beta fold hydrolase [Pseudanabaena galeata CCNP1313]